MTTGGGDRSRPPARGPLAFDEFGSGDDEPPIVLLPGLTFIRQVWTPIVGAIHSSAPSRRVLTVDLPGHGDSPAQPSHDLQEVVRILHATLEDANVAAPIMVGHSISGVLASLYAAQFATSGVINLDQPLAVEPFTQLVQSLQARLRGPEFDRTWQEVFAASFHCELLPARTQQLIADTSRPSREIVLSYWQTLLDEPAGQIQCNIDRSLRELSRRRVPYLLLLGHQPPVQLVEMLIALMPTMQIETWPGTGHFPHLARPDEFADLVLGLRADRQRHNEAVRGTW